MLCPVARHADKILEFAMLMIRHENRESIVSPQDEDSYAE